MKNIFPEEQLLTIVSLENIFTETLQGDAIDSPAPFRGIMKVFTFTDAAP
ncbi:hypothetical protein [Janthinobacterium sp. BJB304]|nr:hypothetical protein [Janthinobacterium sp. BJB304]